MRTEYFIYELSVSSASRSPSKSNPFGLLAGYRLSEDIKSREDAVEG